MNTYKAPSVKVVILDLTAIICLSPSDPDANSTTERLEEDDFKW